MAEPQPVDDRKDDKGDEHPDIGDAKGDRPGVFRALQTASQVRNSERRPATGRPTSMTDADAMCASQL